MFNAQRAMFNFQVWNNELIENSGYLNMLSRIKDCSGVWRDESLIVMSLSS